MTRPLRVAVLLLAVMTAAPGAQRPLFTDAFPPGEFAARRAKVFDAIGDGVAVLQGAAEYPAYVRFRQSNQFFYLTGVEVPRALLLLDGRARSATLFLQPRNESLERSEGPVLVPGGEAERLTGIAAVRPRAEFGDAFKAAAAGRTVFVPHRAESLAAATPEAASSHAEATASDPWDGRPSREAQFIERLTAAVPGVAIEDLDPVLDRLRLIKSPREIAVIREATRLASTAIAEVVRSARPGMREHQLEAIADYIFKQGGAQGHAYFALVAAGRNAYYPHYHGGAAELTPGDLVLFDYAPDFKYYASDVTRMFPVSGRFSRAQREQYTVYLRMYRALMESIEPGAAPRDVMRAATLKMDRIVSTFGFGSEATREAAKAFVERHRRNTWNSLGHMVGMEVHDVHPPIERLEPGMVFTIEPALTIEGERVYIRLEDVILITPAGYENLSAALPMEPGAIESLMAQQGRFADRAVPAVTR